MKSYYIFLFVLVCFSCKSSKNFEESPTCPEGYDCAAEIIKNKSIVILEDTIGKNYVKLEDSDKFHTIKYTYSFKSRPELADANYSEVFYFHFPVDTKNMLLNGKEVQDANFIIAKHCFCPDAGYEVINDGNITIELDDNKYYLSLGFQSDKAMRVNTIKTAIEL